MVEIAIPLPYRSLYTVRNFAPSTESLRVQNRVLRRVIEVYSGSAWSYSPYRLNSADAGAGEHTGFPYAIRKIMVKMAPADKGILSQ